jgi:hypothetical protein
MNHQLKEKMKAILKKIYEFKIRVMFFFNLGFNEVANMVSLVKDLAILIGFGVLVLKFHISLLNTILIAIATFLLFIGYGILLKITGMSDYQNRITNSVNPELKKINAIAKHLGVDNE